MPEAHWTADLYKAIDAKDTKRFLSFLTENAQFRFGNYPPAIGHTTWRGTRQPKSSAISKPNVFEPSA